MLVALSLIFAANATAFVEVGNKCTAHHTRSDVTMLQLQKDPESALPMTAPIHGVVTKWRVNLPEAEISGSSARLIVFRSSTGENEFEAVADSSTESLSGGQNVFDTRIPVHTGDRFGLYGNPDTPYCESTEPDVAGISIGDTAVGSTQEFMPMNQEAKVAVSAIVEADADGDGYGDESQDGCPTNGNVHFACPDPSGPPEVKRVPLPPPIPQLGLGVFPLERPGATLVLTATTLPSTVWAKGFARLPGGRRGAKQGARGNRVVRLGGPPRTVQPGRIAPLRVRYPKKLRVALSSLPRKRSLPLRLATIAVDPFGRKVRRLTALKLPGRKRAQRPQRRRR